MERFAKGALVGVGVGFASLVAIPAAVTALGFGAGGIVGGSTAAWMMSLGGGTTPAIVSVCQSIGATGVIAGSTAVKCGLAAGAVTAMASSDSPKGTKKGKPQKKKSPKRNGSESEEDEEEEEGMRKSK
ncbi:hypothetical protein QR680_019098 [Steinernema hermaphroditum]|uniref:Uncharacterized protein n=1 Tax=Steinernema hermaphroditum TaxID=289476 RepID=A0AA39LS12_9BILA|nr:hypothetical protein QR680_019098 [Steinernema hermaphroditum]